MTWRLRYELEIDNKLEINIYNMPRFRRAKTILILVPSPTLRIVDLMNPGAITPPPGGRTSPTCMYPCPPG